MATENGLYNTTSSAHNGIILNKLHDSLKLLNLRPALYIPMQKAVILNTCRIARKFFSQQWITSAWSVGPYSFENQLNCCEVRKVDDIIIIIIVIIIIYNIFIVATNKNQTQTEHDLMAYHLCMIGSQCNSKAAFVKSM
jgi:hypothetical protein